MNSGDERNWGRLVLTLAGFRGRYRRWPSHVGARADCVESLRDLLGPDGWRALQQRMRVEAAREIFTALDGTGRRYEYGETQPSLAMQTQVVDWLGFEPWGSPHDLSAPAPRFTLKAGQPPRRPASSRVQTK